MGSQILDYGTDSNNLSLDILKCKLWHSHPCRSLVNKTEYTSGEQNYCILIQHCLQYKASTYSGSVCCCSSSTKSPEILLMPFWLQLNFWKSFFRVLVVQTLFRLQSTSRMSITKSENIGNSTSCIACMISGNWLKLEEWSLLSTSVFWDQMSELIMIKQRMLLNVNSKLLTVTCASRSVCAW